MQIKILRLFLATNISREYRGETINIDTEDNIDDIIQNLEQQEDIIEIKIINDDKTENLIKEFQSYYTNKRKEDDN